MAVQHHLRQPSSRILGISAAMLLLLAGCEPAPEGVPEAREEESTNIVTAEQRTPVLPQVPAPLPPLGRRELITAATMAADAFAGGTPLPDDNAALVGRSFEIRIPFGCSGPALEDDWAGWSYNPENRVLKLFARPQTTEDWPHLRTMAGDMRFDAAEGFWLRRPWTSAEKCPAAVASALSAVPGEAQPERQTLGMVRFFSPDEPRTLRRGPRPYSTTIKLDVNEAAKPREFRLVLSGRITGYSDKQSVHCWTDSTELRPICLFAVEFSRVAFEGPDGRILSEWHG